MISACAKGACKACRLAWFARASGCPVDSHRRIQKESHGVKGSDENLGLPQTYARITITYHLQASRVCARLPQTSTRRDPSRRRARCVRVSPQRIAALQPAQNDPSRDSEVDPQLACRQPSDRIEAQNAQLRRQLLSHTRWVLGAGGSFGLVAEDPKTHPTPVQPFRLRCAM